MRKMRAMKMMVSTVEGCTRTTRCDHLKGSDKQKDHLEFHYALQRHGGDRTAAAVALFCGEARRLIEQYGDKRARKLTKTFGRI